MFVEFDQMPGDSRIWIYQADREFSDEEVKVINSECEIFLTQWTAHGAGLISSAKIAYNRFLIISLDEKQAMASGCSIDSCVHFVQSLSKMINADFFNRTQVAFLSDEEVIIESLDNIKKSLTSQTISGEMLTFNNLIQIKSELDTKWITPVSETWLSRYFKNQKV